ncbi:Uncharacterized conserved protein [Syntrophus gentianae]|uniref:Uncharacterized conserved protein n=1 Tax=Syntrophus gentianae TaxID=43775 RepID=A0A1H7VPP2_9BACT|nr:transporter [Syntrophus gentianae]SEM11150.1 Uncharacterized conserved protein [Syntrophus gentianae]
MRKKLETFRKWFTMLMLATVLLSPVVFTGTALATEGGGGAYPNGADDFMLGALPPPGFYFKNHLNYYTAKNFKDNDGNDLIHDFNLKVTAEVLRFIYVTDKKILGANWAVHAFVPMLYMDVEAGGGGDNRFGLGDIIVNPIILGWHFKNFHVVTGLDIFMPTGDYDKTHMANPGRNYWTFEPVFCVTYLSDGGFEASAKLMYDFNTKNNDTNYQSGQEFHADYTLGYHINKELAVGVGGYYYHQMTNDEQDGKKVGTDGFEGRVFAIGPEVKYDYKNMMFILKWQPEIEARNRPEGDKFWFNVVYAF